MIGNGQGLAPDNDTWDQNWSLDYIDSQLEMRYEDYYGRQCLSGDMVYMAISTLVWCIPMFRLFAKGGPNVRYVVMVALLNLCLSMLSYGKPALFLKHRTAFLVAQKLLSSLLASQIQSAPTSRPVESLSAFLTYLLLYSKLLMSVANGVVALQLTFRLHALEHFASLIITLAHNGTLCRDVQTNLVGARERFTALASALSLTLTPFEAGQVSSVHRMLPDRTCLWVFSWLQITIGFLLSLALVYAADGRNRRKFERLERGAVTGGPVRTPVTATSYLWPLNVLPLGGLCVWAIMHSLEAAIQYLYNER